MKPVSLFLAISIAMVVLGCQNESVTEPTGQGANTSAIALPKDKVVPQVILLRGILKEPGGLNTMDYIEGSMEVSTHLATDGVLRQFKVGVATFAELSPFGANNSNAKGWIISGSSADDLSIKSSSTLEKIYTVIGRDDQLQVHVRVGFFRDGKAQLDKMWLAKAKGIDREEDGR